MKRDGSPQVQSDRQSPGQAASSGPSQASPGLLCPSPNSGAQVQLALHGHGQAARSKPSHCSVAWFTIPSPHTGAGGVAPLANDTASPMLPSARIIWASNVRPSIRTRTKWNEVSECAVNELDPTA